METIAGKILRQELARRCEKNPRYSLRSFARSIGVSPANLSLVISGKREISFKTAEKILERVELSSKDRARLLREIGREAPLPRENFSLENIERVCHWQCYAILSLMLTPDFESSVAWVARRLGISVFEAQTSLDALVSTGVLDVSSSGWEIKHEIRVGNRVSTSTIRDFHRQLIKKAVESMENDPMEMRDISSITFAMSPSRMQQAKEEIRRFRLRMSEIFEEPGSSTEVYNLTVQMVPATKGES